MLKLDSSSFDLHNLLLSGSFRLKSTNLSIWQRLDNANDLAVSYNKANTKFSVESFAPFGELFFFGTI